MSFLKKLIKNISFLVMRIVIRAVIKNDVPFAMFLNFFVKKLSLLLSHAMSKMRQKI